MFPSFPLAFLSRARHHRCGGQGFRRRGEGGGELGGLAEGKMVDLPIR